MVDLVATGGEKLQKRQYGILDKIMSRTISQIHVLQALRNCPDKVDPIDPLQLADNTYNALSL